MKLVSGVLHLYSNMPIVHPEHLSYYLALCEVEKNVASEQKPGSTDISFRTYQFCSIET